MDSPAIVLIANGTNIGFGGDTNKMKRPVHRQ